INVTLSEGGISLHIAPPGQPIDFLFLQNEEQQNQWNALRDLFVTICEICVTCSKPAPIIFTCQFPNNAALIRLPDYTASVKRIKTLTDHQPVPASQVQGEFHRDSETLKASSGSTQVVPLLITLLCDCLAHSIYNKMQMAKKPKFV
ncbi:hypothetical protein BaRGS_00033599, partial [Batillaria attramentaria]